MRGPRPLRDVYFRRIAAILLWHARKKAREEGITVEEFLDRAMRRFHETTKAD